MNSFPHFLHDASYLVYFTTSALVAFFSLGAYKKARKPAFLLWFCASLLGILTTILSWSINWNSLSEIQYVNYYSLYQLAYIANIILFTIGVLLFINEYCPSSVEPSSEPSAKLPVVPLLPPFKGPLTTIRTFTNQVEASIVATFLKDKDIIVVLLDQNSGMYIGAPTAAPIRLQVPDEQFLAAQQWLAEFDVARALPPDEKTDF